MEFQQRQTFPTSLLCAQRGGNLKRSPAASPSDVRLTTNLDSSTQTMDTTFTSSNRRKS